MTDLSALGAFANHLPVRIRFGDGVVAALPEALAAEGVRRAFVLVDPHVAGLPGVVAALDGCRGAGIEVVVHEAAPGEPTTASVDAAGAALAASGADGVVAIGGGSVLDTAKGARVVAELGAPIARFGWPGGDDAIRAPLARPLVTVPTTAGTGSEVTGGIVMVDAARGIKVGAASPWNRAAHALVDPQLTHALPAGPTLWGGLDALAQGIGPVVVKPATPIGDAIGLEAVRYAAAALPRVVADPSDADARRGMACASLLAGLAMNISEAGTEHSLAHPLGALHGIPHGLAVGLCLAEAMEHDRHAVPERFERVADALGAPDDGTRDGSRAVRAVQALLVQVGVPTLRDQGIGEGDVDRLADAALAAWIPVEPGPWTRDDVVRAYRAALAVVR